MCFCDNADKLVSLSSELSGDILILCRGCLGLDRQEGKIKTGQTEKQRMTPPNFSFSICFTHQFEMCACIHINKVPLNYADECGLKCADLF